MKKKNLLLIRDELKQYNYRISKNNKLDEKYTKSTEKTGTKNWVKVSEESRGTSNANSQINSQKVKLNSQQLLVKLNLTR